MRDDLPHLEACVATYLALWERFGDEAFSGVEAAAVDEERLAETPEPSLDRRLDLLVAYGLLDRTGAGYRVRCSPDGTTTTWRDRFADRAERLYGRVDAAVDATATGGADDRILTRRGRRYASVFVDEGTDGRDVADRAERLDDEGRSPDGLVLRCPAEEADRVQAIADDLIEDVHPAVEKVGSDVTGVDSDALEFRLFVAPTDGD